MEKIKEIKLYGMDVMKKFGKIVFIFGFATFIAFHVSSFGKDLETSIKNQEQIKAQQQEVKAIQDAPHTDWFNYFGVWLVNESGIFSSQDEIIYVSDRAIYRFINSLNFSESIFIEEVGGTYRWKYNIDDVGNVAEPNARSQKQWTLKFKCPIGEPTRWKVRHVITAIVEYGIPKPQPEILTYFECNGK